VCEMTFSKVELPFTPRAAAGRWVGDGGGRVEEDGEEERPLLSEGGEVGGRGNGCGWAGGACSREGVDGPACEPS
jgi:hypothetical protein